MAKYSCGSQWHQFHRGLWASVQFRVPSANTSLFSQELRKLRIWGTTQNLNPKGLSSWQMCVCVCEAQTCSQQLTQVVHLAQGAVFWCLPLNSFVLTLFPSQSYLNQSRGEASQVEQAGAIPSQTSGRDKMKHFGNKPTLLTSCNISLVISHKLSSFSSFHCLHSDFSESSQEGLLLPSNSTWKPPIPGAEMHQDHFQGPLTAAFSTAL